ncbi:MAG: IPT/TIG domain-containing protein [Nocardiopsaceae bacterium]|nr:IPT/TIG domain-containing protein [Nocardiopsaceae bacterium]
MNPAAGPIAGGTTVTITGSGFTQGSTVSFGDFGNPDASGVTVNSAGTQLTAVTPPGPVGPAAITVKTPGGSSAPSAHSKYTYVPTANQGASAHPGWIAKGDALNAWYKLDPQAVMPAFDNPDTYVITYDYGSACPAGDPTPPPGTVPKPCKADPLPSGMRLAVPTASFTSYAKMKAVLDANALPAGVRAVLYDPESWSFTPTDEQLNPKQYAEEVSQLAHAHGLTFVDTPAQDLVDTLGKNPGESNWQAYLRYGLAASAARYADVVDFQVQGSEGNYATYLQIVRAFAAQARSANPRTTLYAGLATNPSGQYMTPEWMYQAAVETEPVVSGYWLNDAYQSADCPKCTGPYPQRAVDFLDYLAHDGLAK